MPLALMLGLKREAIGATHSINRETNLALITDMYGPDSPETRGSLSIYVVGGMIGTIYFGFMVSIIASLNIFHPYALGMSSGVGAGIMMASATAVLTEIYPAMADQISALASASGPSPASMASTWRSLSASRCATGCTQSWSRSWPQKQQERKQNQRIISGGTNQYEIH